MGLLVDGVWRDDSHDPSRIQGVGISAPSRSGTTHLTVETILQGEAPHLGPQPVAAK